MKKASFKTTITSPCGTKSSTAYGSVTLKDNNKVSISIEDRNWLSYSLRSLATKTANEIVAADFNHPAIIGQVESSDSGILGILMRETHELKLQLLDRTELWAKQSFTRIETNLPSVIDQKKSAWNAYNDACVAKLPTWNLEKAYYSIVKKVETMKKIVSGGVDKYVVDQLNCADAHYQSSLSKLALRITQKGMDMKNFTLVSGYVGINLEMTMSDGAKSVRAWTIWAAEDSELVSPHYRYLVK
jgi:hypothetical protein